MAIWQAPGIQILRSVRCVTTFFAIFFVAPRETSPRCMDAGNEAGETKTGMPGWKERPMKNRRVVFFFCCQQVVAESEELNVEGFVCARSQAKLLLLVKRMRDESRIRARKFHVSISLLDGRKVWRCNEIENIGRRSDRPCRISCLRKEIEKLIKSEIDRFDLKDGR